MFYYLTGELVHVGENLAVIDCGGVGFRLIVSATTLSLLPRPSAEGEHCSPLYAPCRQRGCS